MSFDDAFDALLGHEGGYSNHPDDPGGETMWGVTARVARGYGYRGEMRNLPRETAKAIYRKLYWTPLGLDQFDPRIAFQCFDANVNGGKPVLWMQQAAGAYADGILGPATMRAVAACDPDVFCRRFNSYRLAYLTNIKTWPTFGRGWARRVAVNLLNGD
jgi:lysozyme family protein